MLSSAEHEICSADKSQMTHDCEFVLAYTTELETFIANKYENALKYCWHFIFIS